MKKICLSIFLFLVFFPKFFGQIGGKHTYEFLNLMTAPRQAALGGKTVANYDQDVNQALYNPATINDQMHNHLAVNYANYYGDVKYGTAAYAYTINPKIQTFYVGVNYVNYGSFEGYDEVGNVTNSFTGSETALYIGYARNIPNTNIFLGANLKFITSTLESYNSVGLATDIGAIYRNPENNLNFAIVVRNFGTQLTTYAGDRESLPFEVMAGVSKKLQHLPLRWQITLDQLQNWNLAYSNPNRSETQLDGSVKAEKVNFVNELFRHVMLGAELFPDKGFNIRLGYNFRRAQELKITDQRTFSGFSAGFGLRINKFKFDYSYSKFTVGANTSLFGLTINL